MGGAPGTRGLRVPAATVVDMVPDGMTVAEIVEWLPEASLKPAAGGPTPANAERSCLRQDAPAGVRIPSRVLSVCLERARA
jgi:hypothetical protein